jgi:septal ring factor EnvC (AmiA/AmiB activator)
MIKNVNQDDGLEEVKVKLNEVINVLVWDNPMATVEKVAQQHLVSHNREIASTRNDLKKTLIEVQEALEKINQSVKDQSIFKTSIEKDQSEFKTTLSKDQSEFKKSITEITDTLQHKIKQFITFYAQVGLHVKELCDGKK